MKIEYESRFNLGDQVYFVKPYRDLDYFCKPAFGEIVGIGLNFYKFGSEMYSHCTYEILYDADPHYNRTYTERDIPEDDVFFTEDEFQNSIAERDVYSDGVTFRYNIKG